jgi:4-hydroxy-2-oxoheptanedioate aldolase
VRLVKQALDLGVQSLLIPMIETVDQAQNMVRATRYPPDGIRGVGASLARASGYGKVEDYVATANAEICLILQVESHAALQEAGAIAALDGVDAVFIGPADLAADMGHSGNSDAPDVQAAIDACIADIRETGTAVGILAFGPVAQSRYAEQGVTFIGVGSDVTTLATGLRAIAGGL